MTKGNGHNHKKTGPPTGYYFDEQAADLAVLFFENFLVHIEGEWAGQAFLLQDWQRDSIIRPLFGWKRPDGTRRYRHAWIEVPRKNGKSTLAAGIALFLLFMDDEPAAQVLGAASDKDQAGIVFDLAKRMVEASPVLSERADTFKRSIVVRSTSSVYRTLSADVKKQHGLNAHGVVFDETHTQPNRDLHDVLTTSTGARRQPLVVDITTAGFDRESIAWELHEHARQVFEGIVEDDQEFVYIRAAGEDDDWQDPKTWRKANPGLGVTVKEEYLAAEANRAKLTPAYLNTFLRLHLNRWTQQQTRWMPMEAWNECAGEVEVATGQVCYAGLDLASAIDIAALLLVFPPPEPVKPEGEEALEDSGLYQFLPFFWVPEEHLIERVRRDRVPYDAWARMAFLKVTPGNVIDYGRIAADIIALGKSFNIREIAFDRWGAVQMSQDLEAAGFTMVAFGQGFASMSPPTKELLRLTLDGRIAHGGHPVLRWMADNVEVEFDAAGNVKPSRKKSREKIDGIVASIMGLDRALRRGEGESVYEQRGLLSL